jgi:5'-deoxynucleotidase YfbR-like HD superfamily hydrolase
MPDDQRRGSWIQTWSGRRVFPLDARPSEICLDDVANALSNVCRFTGHVKFYSVAEHSVRVSRACPDGAALFGLLHDAAEAYLGDVARPWKSCLYVYDPPAHREMEPLRKAEDALLGVILTALRVPEPTPEVEAEVKRADELLLTTEARDLFRWGRIAGWQHTPENGYPELPTRIVPWAPEKAEREFLYRFRELTEGAPHARSPH